MKICSFNQSSAQWDGELEPHRWIGNRTKISIDERNISNDHSNKGPYTNSVGSQLLSANTCCAISLRVPKVILNMKQTNFLSGQGRELYGINT